MNVDQIKAHPFFYGVNWDAIRQIEAPFIPRLRSITDTSYFPTDELEQVPEEPVGGDASGANKDLAFLGYVSSPSPNHLYESVLISLFQIHVQAVHNFFAGVLIACVLVLACLSSRASLLFVLIAPCRLSARSISPRPCRSL